MQDLEEFLADRLHVLWSRWYRYQRDNSTEENIARWDKQSMTSYQNLSEEDKEKDRKLAREILYRFSVALANKYDTNTIKVNKPENLTEEDLRELMKTPAYWRDQDSEIVRRVDQGFKRLYGEN